MNTPTDAQLIVSRDVAALLDRAGQGGFAESALVTDDEREAIDLLREHGFLVERRTDQRRALDDDLALVKGSTATLHVTLLTTLQCNFACGYCFQGDHADHNLHADRMSVDTAARVGDWLGRRPRDACRAEQDADRDERLESARGRRQPRQRRHHGTICVSTRRGPFTSAPRRGGSGGESEQSHPPTSS